MKIKNLIFGLSLLFTMLAQPLHAQVLETEESKPLRSGQFETGTGLAFQTSKEGTESALPIAIEYGLTKKFTLLVEPVNAILLRPGIEWKFGGKNKLNSN